MAVAMRGLVSRNVSCVFGSCRSILGFRANFYSTKPAQEDSSQQKEPELCKGVNYLKDESDPPLLPDSEYPDWLWDLLDPPKEDSVTYRRRMSKRMRRQENEIRRQKKF
ncbi:predicted protein [Nematostella vectensis]|uniref:Large ribosomal subunit protein mL54 n=1 Tax=Nematostella vectensis TaxID=45351 RepID=A7RS73_NEMVE|nr:39S ribosomal protein L54, mitochondrial [Nematostella vectensis]EDO45759.1 predicted protein [Nematostella vectensis]|eukprot:XP_001637822.1 predicted protein [Nematostella vectensis]